MTCAIPQAAFKLQAAADIAGLEEKLKTAEGKLAAAEADVDGLTTKLSAAEAGIVKQGEAGAAIDSRVQAILDTIPILIAQIDKPLLQPAKGSLAKGWLQGTKIKVEISIVQGDRAAPACSEPSGVLKAAGLSIAVSGESGAWKCVISGTLPSLADGEETLTFEAVATDTLARSAKGEFTINYNANTAPTFTNKAADLGTLADADRAKTAKLAPLTAVDAEQDTSELSFSVCDGSSLPEGIKLDATKGTFSGTAARVEKDSVLKFKACVSDGTVRYYMYPIIAPPALSQLEGT